MNPTVPEVEAFLVAVAPGATAVSPLGAGQWSRAYAFEVADEELVLRLGDFDEDFAKDRLAASFRRPNLPVPGFLDMGKAFDGFYAVTRRAHGNFLDQLPRAAMTGALPSLLRMLDAMRNVPVVDGGGFGGWDRSGVAPHYSWPAALLSTMDESPRIAGWHDRLQTWADCQAAYDQGVAALERLVQHVPPDRHLIHGDLLNRNVLVDEAGLLTAVFDWGCSLYGDFLYDVAWLSFCAPYTQGLDAHHLRSQARDFFTKAGADTERFDARVRCYEAHIGLGSIAYNAFLDRRHEACRAAALMLAALARP